jgi:23S rRNA (cytidine1920-2'-O)/16S rRNA (cytidine1409-2'-O)-methyltransferase
MNKVRLDQAMVEKKLVKTRSQAESYIKLGQVTVDDLTLTKPGHFVDPNQAIKLVVGTQYVSRAALKLESAASTLGLSFKNQVVLDVGSSTGGFTDYALKHGAKKVMELSEAPGIVLIDVSFISLKEVLSPIARLVHQNTKIIAMVKPQFEAGPQQVNKGVIKNDSIRRQILKDFETWAKKMFTIVAKADSTVAGAKGNFERFYLLRKI